MLSAVVQSDWDYAKAAHLLNRAGFGGSPEDIAKLVELGPEKAVSSFFDLSSLPAVLPDWAKPNPGRLTMLAQMKDAPEAQRKELRRQQQQQDRQMLLT